MAMLLSEYARGLDAPPRLQVFATDLDDDAIRVARDGLYPATIAADVSADRLAASSSAIRGGYRVGPEMRECVLFASHDLLKDPPFSRLDLVTCRNLFIYLNRDAQHRALEIIHFALRPGGRLFLGVSETAEMSDICFGSSTRSTESSSRGRRARAACRSWRPTARSRGRFRCTARARWSALRRWPDSASPATPRSSPPGRAPKRSASARGASCTSA